MSEFQIVPIDESIAKEVRASMRAPGYGHPAYRELASGTAPCRLCLRPIEPGLQRLIGFTYDAFAGWADLPLPGPIFIHQCDCVPYQETSRFPETLLGSSYMLQTYHRGRVLSAERIVRGVDADECLADIFDAPEVAYVHVRSARAGCFEFAVRARGDSADALGSVG